MGGIVPGVDIQGQLDRRDRGRANEGLQEGFSQAGEVLLRGLILQPADRRLAGQVGVLQGKAVAADLEDGITAEIVGIVGVLVAAGDLEDALAEEIEEGVVDPRGVTRVTDRLGHRFDQADLGFSPAEQEKAGVGGQLAALEIDGEGVLAMKRQMDLCATLCVGRGSLE